MSNQSIQEVAESIFKLARVEYSQENAMSNLPNPLHEAMGIIASQREQGKKEGYRSGFAKGFVEGEEEAEKTIQTMSDEISKLEGFKKYST